MKRFLEIKLDGDLILSSDNPSVDNYKSAAFYLDEVTKSLSDEEFKQWLLYRMNTGFNSDDIETLRSQHKHPVLKNFLQIMNFPIFCTTIINSCITLNELEP